MAPCLPAAHKRQPDIAAAHRRRICTCPSSGSVLATAPAPSLGHAPSVSSAWRSAGKDRRRRFRQVLGSFFFALLPPFVRRKKVSKKARLLALATARRYGALYSRARAVATTSRPPLPHYC